MYKRHMALAALTAALLMGGTSLSTAHAEDGPPPPEAGKYDGKHGKFGKDRGAKMFEEADKNKDGVLTKEEMLEAHKARVDEMFEKFDTDKSGTLTREELDKGREEMRSKMKERFKDRGDKHGDKHGGPKDEKTGDKSE